MAKSWLEDHGDEFSTNSSFKDNSVAEKMVDDSNKKYNYGDFQITTSKLTNLHLGQHPPDDTKFTNDNDRTRSSSYLQQILWHTCTLPIQMRKLMNGYFQEAQYILPSKKEEQAQIEAR